MQILHVEGSNIWVHKYQKCISVQKIEVPIFEKWWKQHFLRFDKHLYRDIVQRNALGTRQWLFWNSLQSKI